MAHSDHFGGRLLKSRTKRKRNITEVDGLQAVSGDQFFRPSGFHKTAPTIFDAKHKPGLPPSIPIRWTPATSSPKANVNTVNYKKGNGAPRTLNRKELVYVASSYADRLFETHSTVVSLVLDLVHM